LSTVVGAGAVDGGDLVAASGADPDAVGAERVRRSVNDRAARSGSDERFLVAGPTESD